MKLSFSSYSLAMVALVAAPLCARADVKPNFDDDAKPILGEQPGLIEYVESRFQVKETGTAKYPGDDDHAPEPPYIFRARQKGSNGPYNLKLLIQPGPPGHILGIVKDSATTTPPVATAKAPVSHPLVAPSPAPSAVQTPPAGLEPIEPTSATPSGPIGAPTNPPPATSSNPPGLTPPPDPAPAPH